MQMVMKNFIQTLLVSASPFLSLGASAEVRFPNVIANGMVLQQCTEAALWGTATPGSAVKITPSWSQAVKTVKTDKNSKWHTSIATPVAGGPYSIRFDDGQVKELADIYVGEVWLCSGQSNMGLSVGRCLKEGEKFDFIPSPGLHIFKVENQLSLMPVKDVKASWQTPTAENTPGFSAICYYFGRELQKYLVVPVGILQVAHGGSSQESWLAEKHLDGIPSMAEALAKASKSDPDEKNKKNKIPTTCYNGMLAPVIPFTVRGVCWYQGEANTSYPETYSVLLERMIDSWRAAWDNPQMPFIIAQLAGFNPKGDQATGWVDVQMEQIAISSRKPGVATVLNYDIGEARDIHPKNKIESARRFLLAARKLAYGENILAQGPEATSIVFSGNKAVITYKSTGTGTGLVLTGGELLNNFYIAGAEKKFHPATARIVPPDRIEVFSHEVPQPKYVDYATKTFNSDVNFYNDAMLPAVPFRMADDGVGQNKEL